MLGLKQVTMVTGDSNPHSNQKVAGGLNYWNSEWVIKFNGNLWTADIGVHVAIQTV